MALVLLVLFVKSKCAFKSPFDLAKMSVTMACLCTLSLTGTIQKAFLTARNLYLAVLRPILFTKRTNLNIFCSVDEKIIQNNPIFNAKSKNSERYSNF